MSKHAETGIHACSGKGRSLHIFAFYFSRSVAEQIAGICNQMAKGLGGLGYHPRQTLFDKNVDSKIPKKYRKMCFPKMSNIHFPGLRTLRIAIWTKYFLFSSGICVFYIIVGHLLGRFWTTFLGKIIPNPFGEVVPYRIFAPLAHNVLFLVERL